MRPDSFRFSPPAFPMPYELLWTLRAAFSPAPSTVGVVVPDRTLAWAGALGLRERIAARISAEDRSLPTTVLDQFKNSREQLAARTLLLERLLERVVGEANELGISVIALKGIALLEAGFAQPGERPLLDLDLLVEASRADELAAALTARGIATTGEAESHHLRPMADPELGELEIHTAVPGLSIGGTEPATAEAIRAAGLTRPSERLTGLELPSREFLAAHAVAHAIDQHGYCPTACPVTRLISDLVDLDATTLSPEVREWVATSVSERELCAAEELCSALEGARAEIMGDPGDLLYHTLCAVSSPTYRRALRRRGAFRALRKRQWSKFGSELLRRTVGRTALG